MVELIKIYVHVEALLIPIAKKDSMFAHQVPSSLPYIRVLIQLLIGTLQ